MAFESHMLDFSASLDARLLDLPPCSIHNSVQHSGTLFFYKNVLIWNIGAAICDILRIFKE